MTWDKLLFLIPVAIIVGLYFRDRKFNRILREMKRRHQERKS